MGYTTDFNGRFELDKPLTEGHANYLHKFAETRRVKRDPKIAERIETENDSAVSLRKTVDLPIGEDGAFFLGLGEFGQDRDESVLDYNHPPNGQPGLWCQWIPSEDNKGIEWDLGEKFYDYVEWIEYIIDNFLKPWGYVLNGQVNWIGEDEFNDQGSIHITNNKVETRMRPDF